MEAAAVGGAGAPVAPLLTPAPAAGVEVDTAAAAVTAATTAATTTTTTATAAATSSATTAPAAAVEAAASGGGSGSGGAHDHDHSHHHDHDHGHGHDHDGSVMDGAERAHWEDVLHAFEDYGTWMALELARRRRAVAAIPPHLASLLPPGSSKGRDTALERCTAANAAVLRAIAAAQRESGLGGGAAAAAAASAPPPPPPPSPPPPPGSALPLPTSSPQHFSKVKSTLHQLARDWSAEGGTERDTSYGPILAALRAALPLTADNVNRQRVAVPGCGLGRLVWELARAGYAAQGCEFSYFMLFASHYILNCTDAAAAVVVHPWIHDSSNHLRVDDMVRRVATPDVHPASALLAVNPGADMSMAAGDFVTIYGAPEQAGAWDAVATCFFIDTAPCILEYIDVVWRMLRPGGVWVNNGPLLYHWQSSGAADDVDAAAAADDRYSRSLELPYADVRYALVARGFTLSGESSAKTTYAANKLSLMKTAYTTIIFTATKPATAAAAAAAAAPKAGGARGRNHR